MYYFAYASSLSKKQMLERCPDSNPLFRATLPNYKLIFTGWSRKWHVLNPIHKNTEYDVDEDMNNHSRPAGIPPIGHIAEIKAHGYSAKNLYLRFSEME